MIFIQWVIKGLTSFAQAAGITDVTLRRSVKDIKKQLLLLN
jgi:hypothetical protein